MEPESRGLVIIGANKVARTLAEALEKQEIPALLIDSNWENISEARLQGLKTLHGNPLSSRIEEKLELTGYGQMLAATPQRDLNALCCMHFRREFAARFIFKLNTDKNTAVTRRYAVSESNSGHTLGVDAPSFKKLSSLFNRGATIKTTRLSEDYPLERWLEENSGSRILLMAVTPEGRLRMFAQDVEFKPREGWVLMALDTAGLEDSGNAAGNGP
jgi:hypothetical protein